MYNERFQRLLVECKHEMDMLKIPYDKSINYLEVNTRAKGRWGQCRKRYGEYSINLSSELLKCNNKSIKDTIIHELIHTVEGCMNHGEKFQYYANLMNKQYGYNIKRVTSMSEKGFIVKEDHPVKSYKYTVICKSCNTKSNYQRMTSTLKNLKNCSCNICKSHGNFNLIQNY